jgi:hypothetical protein
MSGYDGCTTDGQTTLEVSMSIDRIVMAWAGVVVLVSLLLAQVHSGNWLWLTAFVGANLFQSAFTGFCPLAALLRKMGVKAGAAFYPSGP